MRPRPAFLSVSLTSTAYAGHGYATEAFSAVLPQLFDRIPRLSEGGLGYDHVEGWVDAANTRSRRILEKCGFTLCEIVPPKPEHAGAVMFRKARPGGKTLEELGLLASPADGVRSEAPTPPVQ